METGIEVATEGGGNAEVVAEAQLKMVDVVKNLELLEEKNESDRKAAVTDAEKQAKKAKKAKKKGG